jgi:hypothetical protein
MNKDLRNSFLIALLYVGSGTLALMFANSSNILVPIILLITIPVTFIGFGIAYTEADSTMLILLVQLIVFLIFWAILYSRFKKRTARAAKAISKKPG